MEPTGENEIKTTWEKIMGMLTPSTISGIVIVCGTLGWNFTEGKVQAWIAVITLLIYGFYEILRTDSADKAINAIMAKIGKIAIVFIVVAVMPLAMAHAEPDLCLEPSADVEVYELKIDGTIIGELGYVDWNDGTDDWHCIYDLGATGLAPGDHTAEARALHSSGMPGDWSVPLVLKKPGRSTRWKIRR